MTTSRSPLRRFERWLVGLFMAWLVLVLERLVMHQIKKKERARPAPSPDALVMGEE
ncbi:MAG TPA: hypothetical protein VFZ75_07305 [Actinomycetota bacterium]|nr:hypothetical protein [Actinomycetota bacterium]